jgi:glycosyltransferase involved in cell wall biosynthesis
MTNIAVIVAAYNEEDLIHQFLFHYCPLVDKVFLLDNESTDRTVEIASKFRNVEISSWTVTAPDFNVGKHDAIMKRFNYCIGVYDFAILVDVDEFIVPNGSCSGIREKLRAYPDKDVYKTVGYNMVPPAAAYSPTVPITRQFRRGVKSTLYSKPAIIRPSIAATFSPGVHEVSGINRSLIADGLFKLLHIPGPTEDIFVRRRMRNESRRMFPSSRRTEEQLRREFRAIQKDHDVVEVI